MVRLKKERLRPEINAGSMADIAFLLLIFFLVTTTVVSETGIRVKLPPYQVDGTSQVAPRNKLDVLINSKNKLLVEGEEFTVERLKKKTKEFIMNPNQLNTLAASPQKAVVSLINDRKTSYEKYIAVYNEIKAAYNELWEEAAQQQYLKSYEFLTEAEKKAIRKNIPLVISEADPVDL